jgi:hypothetical protein
MVTRPAPTPGASYGTYAAAGVPSESLAGRVLKGAALVRVGARAREGRLPVWAPPPGRRPGGCKTRIPLARASARRMAPAGPGVSSFGPIAACTHW